MLLLFDGTALLEVPLGSCSGKSAFNSTSDFLSPWQFQRGVGDGHCRQIRVFLSCAELPLLKKLWKQFALGVWELYRQVLKGSLLNSEVGPLDSEEARGLIVVVHSQSLIQLCNPRDCSAPGFPVLHSLPESAQIHIRWLSDAVQPSRLLSSPSPFVFNLYQNQGLFHCVSSSHQVAKELELWVSVTVFPMKIQDWFPLGLTSLISLGPRDSQESFPAPQFKIINSSTFLMVQFSYPYMTTGKAMTLTIWAFVGKWWLCFLICCLGLSGLPQWLRVKESTCNIRDLNLIPGWRRSPGRECGNPTPVFLPGEYHGQRSLVSCSP